MPDLAPSRRPLLGPLRSTRTPSGQSAYNPQVVLLTGVVVLNVVLALAVVTLPASAALGVAVFPPLLLLVTHVVLPRPGVLVFAALGLTIFGGPLNNPLPFSSSATLFPADVLVGLGLVSWVVERTTTTRTARPRLRTPVLGPPLVLLSAALLTGVLRGHARYGLPYFSQPVRIFVYAGIAVAIADLTARSAYRGIVWTFYLGAAWSAILALYYLATGGSETGSVDLSTGGTRVLSLSTAMFLAASDRKSTRLNSSHIQKSRMPSSA